MDMCSIQSKNGIWDKSQFPRHPAPSLHSLATKQIGSFFSSSLSLSLLFGFSLWRHKKEPTEKEDPFRCSPFPIGRIPSRCERGSNSERQKPHLLMVFVIFLPRRGLCNYLIRDAAAAFSRRAPRIANYRCSGEIQVTLSFAMSPPAIKGTQKEDGDGYEEEEKVCWHKLCLGILLHRRRRLRCSLRCGGRQQRLRGRTNKQVSSVQVPLLFH